MSMICKQEPYTLSLTVIFSNSFVNLTSEKFKPSLTTYLAHPLRPLGPS